MAHDVFISYSSKDKTAADAACARLEEAGIRCWIAPRDILAGQDWDERIIDGIDGSKLFLLVFSSHANASRHVKREVERAVNKGLPIVPLRIEDVVPAKSLEYFLSTPHWLDAITPPFKSHLDHLAQTVKILLERGDGDMRRLPPPKPIPIWKRRPGAVAVAGIVAIVLMVLLVRALAPDPSPGESRSEQGDGMHAETSNAADQPAEEPPGKVPKEFVGTWKNEDPGNMVRSVNSINADGAYEMRTTFQESGTVEIRQGLMYLVTDGLGERLVTWDFGPDQTTANGLAIVPNAVWGYIGMMVNSGAIAGGADTMARMNKAAMSTPFVFKGRESTAHGERDTWEYRFTLGGQEWVVDFFTGGPNAPYQIISETVDRGTMHARDGKWTSQTSGGGVVQGEYEILDNDTITMKFSFLPPALWKRVK